MIRTTINVALLATVRRHRAEARVRSVRLVLLAAACGDANPGPGAEDGSDAASAPSSHGDAETSTTHGSDDDPFTACAAMCNNDISCDPDHEPWTLDECTAVCLGDLDTDGGPCRSEYVALWSCVGGLSCTEYVAWVYGAATNLCSDEVAEIDACEGT